MRGVVFCQSIFLELSLFDFSLLPTDVNNDFDDEIRKGLRTSIFRKLHSKRKIFFPLMKENTFSPKV